MAALFPDDEDGKSADPEADFSRIARLAAFVCGTPIAAIMLIDAERQWFKAVVGMKAQAIPRDAGFCAYTIHEKGVMTVPDAAQDIRFADHPFVTGEPHIRFYAGAALVTTGGRVLGSLFVIDRIPRHLTAEQEDALQTLAHQAANSLQLEWETEQRQRSENALRLLDGAVASAVEGIVISDARRQDLPIIYANPAFYSLTGYQEREVLGHNCRFLQGEGTDPEAKTQIKEAIVAGHSCRITLLNYKKDGTAFWNELTIAPVKDAEGTLTHFTGVQHDITARKNAEARLIQAQQIGRIGDWQWDLATGQSTWSQEMFRLMEFDPAGGAPLLGAILERYHPDDRAERDRLTVWGLKLGEIYEYDVRLRLPSGTPRALHLVGQPVRGAEGQVVRVVGTALDITERLEREQEARDANQVLEVQKAQLEAANAELAGLATTDPLTGLLNHRAFHRSLEEETVRAGREGTVMAVGMVDLDNFKFFNDVYGHAVGDHVLRLVAGRLRQVCRAYDTVARFGGDEFALLMPGIGRTSAAEVESRLRAGLSDLAYQPEGGETAIPLTASVGVALLQAGDQDRHEVLRQADERLLRAKTGGETEAEADQVRTRMAGHIQGFTMLDALVAAVDNKDRYTRKHSEDVMEYSLMIAREIGLGDEARRTISVAALLHDVGKIGVPDRVLRKPGKLTDEEFEAIKQHPQMGAVMVGAVPGLEETLDAVRHHHERWDGQGYPFGLCGEEVPLTARVMAVADAFSAMTTNRPYRKGMEKEKALSILEAGAGTQWDPKCIRAFLSAQKSRTLPPQPGILKA